MDTLAQLFRIDGFMPHGHCYLWTPSVLWLHVVSDALIVAAYYSIPAALLVFLRRRRDVAFPAVFVLFIAFIFACGTTHLLEIYTTWTPAYGVEGLAKAGTALVSVVTAVVMWPLIPKAIALPSPAQLAASNAALANEIEQRRAAEDRLRELNEAQAVRLAAIVDSSNDAILSTTPDGVIESWNLGAERLYGYRAAEAVGQHVSFLFADAHDPEPEALEQMHASESAAHIEVKRRRADGHVVDVSITLSPLRNAAGEIVGATSIGRDLTELHRTRDRLVATNEQLSQRREEIEHLLYAVSHDLRSPLVTINGFSAMAEELLAEDKREDALHALGRVRRAGSRAGGLIDYLLQLSRATHSLSPQWVDTKQVVDEVREQLEVPLGEKEAELRVQSNLPRAYVDRISLLRILDNLISNALKYGKGEHAHLIEVQGEATPTCVRLRVVDHGPGVPDAERQTAFLPYERLSRNAQGTGLGLAIVARLVHAHGGEVSLEDTPGGGATFTFSLPGPMDSVRPSD